MAVDKSKTVLTFKHPRASRALQEAEGRRFFSGSEPHVLHVGELPRLAIDVARATREGDEVWFWALPMIVVSRKKSGVGMQAQVTLFVKTCAANKATLIEGSTGRTTKSRAQTAAMIDEAHGIIVKGGKRLPRTGATPGRKRKTWPSDEVEKAAAKLWASKNIESDAAAVRQIMDQWSDMVDAKGRPLVTERLVRSLGRTHRNG